MQLIRHPFTVNTSAKASGFTAQETAQSRPLLMTSLLLPSLLLVAMLTGGQALALETDRQKPLEVNANSTDGTLGDGVTTLRGDVDIRQGTLHITADLAEVVKAEGKVQKVTFRGKPASLQQEIEEQGLVQATANDIEYQVATGMVTLSGNADVKHPQYQISGDVLTYDLNIQHFEGNGDDGGNGRIHIRLDPEVLDDPSFGSDGKKSGADKKAANTADSDTANTPAPDAPAEPQAASESQVAPEYDAPFADDANPVDDFSEPDDALTDPDAY